MIEFYCNALLFYSKSTFLKTVDSLQINILARKWYFEWFLIDIWIGTLVLK